MGWQDAPEVSSQSWMNAPEVNPTKTQPLPSQKNKNYFGLNPTYEDKRTLQIGPFDTHIPISDEGARTQEAIGSGLTNVVQGVKQLFGQATKQDVEEKRKLDQPISERPGIEGKWGQIAGELLPFMAMPLGEAFQAGSKVIPILNNLVVQGGLTGGAIGAMAPVGERDSRAKNIVTGGITGSIPGLVNAGYQGIKKLISPLTESGREDAIAKALLQQANDPQKALSNLTSHQEYVPGSVPTTGTASGDPGLLAAERTARSMFPQKFAESDVQNNSARWKALSDLSPDEQAITKAIESRTQQSLPKLKDAIDKAGGKVDTGNILKTINEKLKGPEGVQEAPSKFLNFVKDKLENKVDNSFENLYAVRKDIDDAIAGKLSNEDLKGIRFSKKVAVDIKREIDNALNTASSGKFGEYTSGFKELSKPINAMQAGNEITNKFITAQPDTLGNPTISPAMYRKALSQNISSDFGPNFSPEQESILKGIQSDLNRQGTLASVKPLGSDTYQNLTQGGKLEELAKSGVAKIPLIGSLVKSQSDKTLSLLADALRDPEKASRLMSQGLTKDESTALINALRNISIPSSVMTTYK